jgi:hypothetical protein
MGYKMIFKYSDNQKIQDIERDIDRKRRKKQINWMA